MASEQPGGDGKTMGKTAHLQIEKWIRANEESLIRQSRSFAIPLLKLDDRFKTPIVVEYNLNKTIDTIEDSISLEADEKIDLIHSFCDYLDRDKLSPQVQKKMLEVTPKNESFVFKNYGATINLYNTLSKEEKDLSKKWIKEMAQGMCAFLTRPVQTPQDLDEYCYYVAGTVGIFLTHILHLKGDNVTLGALKKMERNAVALGLFLQKLNIIRDFEEDKASKKWAFWPRSYFEEERDPVKILNKMCYETLKNNLPGAIAYYSDIPPGNDSYYFFIRFILCSGIEYLKILKDNASVFSRKKVKLSRIFIKKLYSQVSARDPDEFRDYCERSYAKEMEFYRKRV